MTIIRTVSVISAALALASLPSAGNPVGGTVVGGNGATISGQGTPTTTINQTANRVIINWQDFSIGLGEVTKFVQPSANSVALNRVFSGNPSQIYGMLQANGRVFVINPNGIMVGAHGQIDTKGFLASTMDMPTAGFLSGSKSLTLSGNSTAAVRNEGTIQALGGDVYLIAHTVENSGTVRAPQGTVGMAAGSQVRLVQSGSERISVLPSGAAGVASADKGVNNIGSVEAASAELKAAGGNIYALAINNGGVVRATGIGQQNGRIVLKANGGNIDNSGTLDASGNKSGGSVVLDAGHNAVQAATATSSGIVRAEGAQGKGGNVRILGDHVGLMGSALVDVNGGSGGGSVLVGGDFQGKNPNVQNASRTFVSADARIEANAMNSGSGGKVVIWADEFTKFLGMISAKGINGGGFAEVSGKGTLSFLGDVDLNSRSGGAGSLLLDPKNIIIAATDPGSGAVDHNTDANDNNLNAFTDNPTETSWLTGTKLGSLLNGADITLHANTDISFRDSVTAASGGHNLTLNAGRTIEFLSGVSLTLNGGGSFSATINDSASQNANRDAGAALFRMDSGSSITAGGGITIAADGSGAGTYGAMTITSLSTHRADASTGVAGGNVSINNAGGGGNNVTILGTIDTSGSSATGSGNAGGNAGTVTITAGAAGVLSAGVITANGGNGVGSGNGGNGGAVDLTGGGGITLNNNISSVHGNGSPNGSDGSQDYHNAVTLGADAILSGGAITFSSTINGAHNLTINNLDNTTAPSFGAAIGGTTPLTSFNLNSLTALTLNRDISAGSVSINSGVDGVGNLSFAAGVHVNANLQTYRAGSGSGNTASVDPNGNTPTFNGSAGTGTSPTTFTVRQDASIVTANIPAAARFGNGVPATYTIKSDGGDVTISDATKVALSALTLAAFTTLHIDAPLNLVSLDATGNGITLNAAGTVGTPTVQTSAGQVYHGTIGLTADTYLKDTGNNAIALTSGVNGSDTLDVDTGGNVSLAGIGGTTRLTGLAVQANTLTLSGDINTRGNVDFTSVNAVSLANNITIDTDDIQNGTAAGNILFGATTTINGNAAGRTLTLDATGQGSDGSGNIALGVVGGTTRLGGLTARGSALTLNGNISTEDGAVDFGSIATVTLAGNITIDTDGTQNGTAAGAITFGAATTIDGNAAGRTLTLDASGQGTDGSGNVALGIVGGATRLGAVTIKAGTLTLNGNISTEDGAVDFTGVSAVTLANNVTIDTDSVQDAGVAGDILFGATTTINGNKTLTLDASGQGTDGSGDVALGVVGGSTRLAGLTAKADAVTLNGNISTEGGAVDFSTVNSVTLASSVTIDTDGTQDTVSAGAITFGNATTINGSAPGRVLILDAQGQGSDGSGNITLGLVGTTSPLLAGLTAKGGILTLNGAIEIDHSGLVDLESVSDIPINANITAGSVLVHSGTDGTGDITFGAGVTIRADTQSYQAGDGLGGGGTTAKVDLLGNTPVFQNTAGSAGPNNFTFRQDAAIAAANIPIIAPNIYTIQSDDGAVTLPGLNLSGTLNVFANGQISQIGALIVPTATFSAGAANNIVLTDAGNNFGTVTFTTGNDVTLNDVNAVILGQSTISGNLIVTAGGSISQSGILDVSVAGKTASFTVPAGADVLLGSFPNKLGAVSVTVSGGGSLNDVALWNTLATASLTGLPLGGLHNLTVRFDAAPLDLPSLSLSGNLDVTALGITDSGDLLVSGTTRLDAGAGNNIILDNANQFVGPVRVVSGNNVTLVDLVALNLGASTISGNLTINANGLISDSGNVTVVGTTSLSAGAGNNIVLDNADDFGGAVTIVTANNVTLNDVNALTVGGSVAGTLTTSAGGATVLQALSVGGNLSVTANGQITDSGNVTVGGTTSLAAGSANDIILNNADDFSGAVSVVSGNNVTLNDINALALGASTISGNLAVTASGLISDAGNVTVNGTTSLAAGVGNNILLDNADDFVGAVTIVSGNSVTLNDVNALTVGGTVGANLTTTAGGATTLGALTVSGNLNATANGPITDSGSVQVFGTTTLAAGAGNNITLNNADDFVGAVSITSGNNVTLNDINALLLGSATVSGNLAITANGSISDSGNVTVVGTTSLAAGAANNIALDNADDFGGAVTIVSANNVTLNDINALTVGGTLSGNLTTVSGGATTLNALTVPGNLFVNANGPITDNGNIFVGGTTALAAGAGNNITLDNANDFVGAVSVSSGNIVIINDVNGIIFGGTPSGNVTISSGGAVALNPMTVPGTLSVTANGPITDNGIVIVNGATTLTAGSANNITLDNADDFVGAVSIVSGKDVTLNDVNALTLGASTISGNLSVTANGDVTDAGNLVIVGTTTISAGAINNITLDNGDDFGGAVNILSGKNVTVNDINALTLGGSVSGDLTITAAGAMTFNTLNVAGNLSATANGPITDNGNVIVSGATTLAAGAANDITLNNSDDFVGPVNIVSGKDVTLNDVNALTVGGTVSGGLTTTAGGATTLAALSVGGNLGVTANGTITDSGNVTVAGSTSLAAGAANDITLDNSDDFGGAVSIVSGNNVTLNDINALALGASTISGNLKVTTAGAITDNGNINVAGTTSLSAGAGNDITLNNADDFVGAVSILSGNNVTLNDVNALTLDTSTISGNLSITANGLISDIGNVTVAGTTSLAAGNANNIVLDNADDFGGAVTIVSGNDVSLNDVNALTVGGTVNGGLTTTAGGATTLAALTVGGNLQVTAGGLISDSGNVSVAGTTSLNAGLANDIVLDNADDFGGGVLITANNVTINDVNALTIGGSANGNLTTTSGGGTTFNTLTVGGNLSTTANGQIADNGNVVVNGTTTLAAGVGNDIVLDLADNFGGAVTIVSGRNVTLNDIDSLTVGGAVNGNLATTSGSGTTFNALTVGGSLNASANGQIVDNGDVTVAGSTTLAAGAANDIILDNSDDFGGAVTITSGNNVTLNDVNGLTVGGTVSGNLATTAGGATVFNALTVGGTLNTVANGPISQNAAIVANGATFTAGAANDINLGNPLNVFGTASIVSGDNVTLGSAGSLDLGASTISGNLNVTTGGNITDSGNLIVAGNSSFTAHGGGSIILDSAGNTFNGSVALGAAGGGNLNYVTIVDTTSFDIGSVTVDQIFSLTSGGNITQSGGVNAHWLALSAAGSIKLGADVDATHTLTTAWPFDNHVDIFSAQTTGAGSPITFKDSSPVSVSGITTAGGNVTLAADSMDIHGIINSGAGRTILVPLTPGRGITLGTEVPGTLSFTALELNNISAQTLQIGDIRSGDMTINDGVSISGLGRILSIRSGGSITESGPGAISVESICIETDETVAGKTVFLLGQNDFVNVAAMGHPISVNDANDFSTALVVDDCIAAPSVDRGDPSHVPVGSELIRFSGADKTIASSAALAGLSSVTIPAPKLDTSTFSGAAVSTEEAAQILPAGSIGTLWLLLPFPPPEEAQYKVEEQSKWTSGRIAAVGSTAGPQSPK